MTFSLRDLVKLKQKQRAREVISQSSNADIRYALHTTFTHNLPGDEDLGENPRKADLETHGPDYSDQLGAIKDEIGVESTIVYPHHSATSPRYLSYHYHHPNSEVLVENKAQTLKTSTNNTYFQPVCHKNYEKLDEDPMWYQSLPPPPPIPFNEQNVQNSFNFQHQTQHQQAHHNKVQHNKVQHTIPRVQRLPENHYEQHYGNQGYNIYHSPYNYAQPVYQHPPPRERTLSSSSSRKPPMSVTFV